eukprot:scaffold5673_cov340-Chaetoceros_neogracile.AAC.4
MNNHLNLEFRAKHIWRKTSSGKFTEKGGGVDGDYRYSKIELIDGSIPKIVIRYGNKPTVIAAVNSVRAQFHAEYEETTYNCMSAALLLSKGTKARGNVEVDELLADLVLDDEEKKKEDVIDVDADEEETDEETHNESEDPGDNDKFEDPGDEGEEEEEWDEDDEPNSQQVFPDGEYTADDLAAFKVAGIE